MRDPKRPRRAKAAPTIASARTAAEPKRAARHHSGTMSPEPSTVARLIEDDEDETGAAYDVIRKAPKGSPEQLLGNAYDLILEAFGKMGYDVSALEFPQPARN